MKAEDLLVACPKCGEWPMVTNERNALWFGKRTVQFVCIYCGHRETSSGAPSENAKPPA